MSTAFLRQIAVLSSVAAAFLSTGCRKAPVFNKDVEGVVRLNGAPLPNATLQFLPQMEEGVAAISSFGTSDENGKFKMIADKKNSGALIAKHKVIVRMGRSSRSRGEEESDRPVDSTSVPVAYTSASSTPIEIEVTADQHIYDIDLRAAPEK